MEEERPAGAEDARELGDRLHRGYVVKDRSDANHTTKDSISERQALNVTDYGLLIPSSRAGKRSRETASREIQD